VQKSWEKQTDFGIHSPVALTNRGAIFFGGGTHRQNHHGSDGQGGSWSSGGGGQLKAQSGPATGPDSVNHAAALEKSGRVQGAQMPLRGSGKNQKTGRGQQGNMPQSSQEFKRDDFGEYGTGWFPCKTKGAFGASSAVPAIGAAQKPGFTQGGQKDGMGRFGD